MDTKHYTGLSSELVAAHYFASNGLGVYWPLMTQSRCDFIIDHDNELARVQVKTATWSKSGNYKYLQARCKPKESTSTYGPEDFDLMVFVRDEKIWLVPWPEICHLTSVCLEGTHPDYKSQTDYDPNLWLAN